MKKVLLKSIGCRTNQVEIAGLGTELVARGYGLVKNYSDADIIIINTCSVTGNTESKVKRLIKSCRKNFPQAKILVTGCLAQQIPRELSAIEGVSWIVGNAKKMDIPQLLRSGEKSLSLTPVVDKLTPVATFDNVSNNAVRTRFHIKIQEGCDFSCTYCIVPILRGPSRSLSKSEVIKQFTNAIRAGHKEIVITGTHIGQYFDGKAYGLGELIDDLCTIEGDYRLRLSSLDPRDCSNEILQRIEKIERICKHLHLSIQSLSGNVIAGMNRDFSGFDQFVEQLISFHNRCPDLGLGGDFIVGFPGETADMFEETLCAIKKIGFNYGHVFRYSKRPGTKAATLDRQVGGKKMVERSASLRECLLTLRQQFIQNQINSGQHKIIIEHEKPVRGITSNYIQVLIPSTSARRNTWCDVIFQEYDRENNWCRAVSVDRR